MNWPVSVGISKGLNLVGTGPIGGRVRIRSLVAVVVYAATLIAPNSCSSFGSVGIGIVMEVHFDAPIGVAEAAEIQAQFVGPSADQPPVQVKCDHNYSWTNAVGTYYIQRACGGSTAPWGFVLSPGVQAVTDVIVEETGMSWTLDGVPQSLQAPHKDEYAGYALHGNYNGLSDGSRVTYRDQVMLRHTLGTGGTATVTVAGQHHFSDEPWE